MGSLAVIGGTGLTQLDGLVITDEVNVETPFGEPSSALLIGDYHGKALIFLPRHGPGHRIPPHKINYRANIWALQQYGVEQIVAVAAVGGIAEDMGPGMLATPDQIIDYTYGREHSFFSDDFSGDKHIDFTYPYDQALRERIINSAEQNNIALLDGGTYGAVQGPRLETAAEIRRMKQDGCTMVGMTGMPEASLARELALPYATIALSANWAAGLSSDNITMMQIEQTVADCIENIRQVLVGVIETQ
jgi:5'-deoxy-5'-methylthioadenosine phosphorylase